MVRKAIFALEKQILDELMSHPLTASIFAYLIQEKRPVGVREVQRKLNLSNPSTAYWHLNKLLNNGILTRLNDNRYEIVEEYSTIRKIPLTVALDYYILGGRLIPSLFLLTIFVSLNIIAVFFFILLGWWPAAAFTGFLTLIVVIGIIVKSYYHLTKPLSPKY